MIVSFLIAENSCWIAPPKNRLIIKFTTTTALEADPMAPTAPKSEPEPSGLI